MKYYKRLKLKITRKEREDIIEKFNVKQAALYNALNFKTHSSIALKIRDYVINTLGHEPFLEEIAV